MNKTSPILQAIERLGGFARTAELLGLRRYQTVQQWVATGQVPAKYCVALEAASGISRYRLRPEDGAAIWPELAHEPAQESADA